MKLQLIICLVVFAASDVKGKDSECTTLDGGVGICKPIMECTDVKNTVNTFNTLTRQMQTVVKEKLQKMKCNDNPIKVCCSECTTPDGKSGVVKDIRKCPHLLTFITGNSYIEKLFANSSKINLNTLDVCCGPAPVSSATSFCDSQFASLPDPNSECCGVDAETSPKIFGGTSTSIYQYPWTVLLEHETKGQIKMICGGTLISNKYVITAAHCVAGFKGWPPVNVRVGEYDTINNDKDCTVGPDGTQDCTDGALSVPVDSYIVHPDYNPLNGRNDIALIRLKYPVKYSYFVRPICLPSENSPALEKLHVAGWGRVNSTSSSNLKQAVKVDLFKFEECNNVYQGYGIKLWEKQMCAGGEAGKDSCYGDSGGPLMVEVHSETPHFELVGVVSFGVGGCGRSGVPGVYTRVASYLDWIRENIRE